jgi:isoleucyl-tRNA synthetase
MIDRNISVHLQDFPDISFLPEESELVVDMDMVRAVCSAALSIRDNKNLRVRLPLNQLTIISKNARRILPFVEIIAEEVNVKNVVINEKIDDLAEVKLQINFKKIGAKFGAKVKEIAESVKKNQWQKISENEIHININNEVIILTDNDFEVKLLTKNIDDKKFAIIALPSNDCLIQLDIEVTVELEEEGIARDIVRVIQQNRKDANLNISDHIHIQIFAENKMIFPIIEKFSDYIKEQVLGLSLSHCDDLEKLKSGSKFFFENEIDGQKIVVDIKV